MNEQKKPQNPYVIPALFFSLGVILLGYGGGSLIYGIANNALSDPLIVATSVGVLMLSALSFFFWWWLLPGNVTRRRK